VIFFAKKTFNSLSDPEENDDNRQKLFQSQRMMMSLSLVKSEYRTRINEGIAQ